MTTERWTRRITVVVATAGLIVCMSGPSANGYSQAFCGYLVAPGQLCGGSGHYRYNLVSNHYPGSNTLWRLCVGAITQAGNFKAVRNGTAICRANANYHFACFLPDPASNGVVWWNHSGSTGAYHTLNGWATTTGAGC